MRRDPDTRARASPARFATFFETHSDGEQLRARLRPGVSPVSALLMATRLYFNYFIIEILFNVAEPFGKDTAAVVREMADIIRSGILA